MTFSLLTYHREVSLFHLLQQDLQRLQIQNYIVGFLQACPKQEQGLIHRGAEARPHSRRSEMVTDSSVCLWTPTASRTGLPQKAGPKEADEGGGRRLHPRVSKGPAQPLPGGADTFFLEGEGFSLGPALTLSDIRIHILQGWPVAAFGFFQDLDDFAHFGPVELGRKEENQPFNSF